MPKGKGPTWEGWAGYPRTSGRLVPRANPTAGLKPGLGAWKPAFPSARGSPGLFPNCPVRAWTRTAQEAQGAHCADSPSWGLGVRCRLSALPARLGTGCGVSRQGAGPRSPLPRGRTAHARPPPAPRAPPTAPLVVTGRRPPSRLRWGLCPLELRLRPRRSQAGRRALGWVLLESKRQASPRANPQPSVWTPGPGWVSRWTPTRQGEGEATTSPRPLPTLLVFLTAPQD